LNSQKISLLAESIKSRISPLSHTISYNSKHVSDRLVIAELENLLRICNSTFPQQSNYFSSINQKIHADGTLPLDEVIQVLDVILELALRERALSVSSSPNWRASRLTYPYNPENTATCFKSGLEKRLMTYKHPRILNDEKLERLWSAIFFRFGSTDCQAG